MSSEAVARRYAGALADVVIANKEAGEVQEELRRWEGMIGASPLFQEVLSNPTIALEQKQRALKELIQRTNVRSTTANFLQVLLRNQRLAQLLQINRKLALVLDERAGVVSADVTSARVLADSSKNLIEENLRGITGRQVRVNFDIDENLIGGIVTRIGSTVYDGSIRTQLKELGKRLSGI